MAKVDGKPASIMVDLGLLDKAPDQRLRYLLVTGPVAKKCNTDGLPPADEINRLEEMLNATDEFILGVTPRTLVGTFTANCERLNYYYVRDTISLRYAIARMYNKSFKDYQYAISIRPDPEWKAYRTFLYPNDETFNWIENNKILSQLIEQKVDLTQAKNINFILYFKTENDRKDFMLDMHNRGYDVKELLNVKDGEYHYGIKIIKYDNLKSVTINAITLEVKDEAKKHNGLYNQWSI